MKSYILPLSCICGLLFFSGAFAQDTLQRAQRDSIPPDVDYVKMKNGDRLLGKILKVQRGDLYFDGDKTGDVKIELKDIRHLKGQAKLYSIELIDKSELIGAVDLADKDGYFTIHGSAGSAVFRIDEISYLRGFETKFIERLDGSIDFGYSFTKSSDIIRYNFTHQIKYTAKKWVLSNIFSGIYTVGDGDGVERIDANLTAFFDLQKAWLLFASVEYQKILELGVESRIMTSGGAGKRIIQSRHVELTAGTGLSTQKEYGTDGSVSDVQVEIPVFVGFNLFRIKKPDIEISSNLSFFYNLSVAGRYRVDYELNFNYEIIKDFQMGFQTFYNFDSKPLAENTASSDFGIVFTLGLKY